MAEISLAAKRYAEAVFAIAVERGEVDLWASALGQIAEFMTDVEVRNVLENSRVPQESKTNLIQAALGDLAPLALNFAKLLVKKGRTALAGEIADEFYARIEVLRGVARVRATTAVPLTDDEHKLLVASLRDKTGKDVMLETAVDPELLGGVVIQIGDRLIDGSTRARLEALRDNLMGSVV